MNALPALLTALFLLTLPTWGSEEMESDPIPLINSAEIEATEASPAVPEPRSMIFVGLGALVMLAFTMRRK